MSELKNVPDYVEVDHSHKPGATFYSVSIPGKYPDSEVVEEVCFEDAQAVINLLNERDALATRLEAADRLADAVEHYFKWELSEGNGYDSANRMHEALNNYREAGK